MNMIKLIDKIKTEVFPLHEHYASDLDQHSRELYVTILAGVVLNKGQISEVETRLFSMLLSSLKLESNTAKYLNLVQQVNLEQTREFFSGVLDSEEMQTVFLMDALILSRIDKPLNDTQMELIAELCDVVDLDEDVIKVAIQFAQIVLGMNGNEISYEFEKRWYEGIISDVTSHISDFGLAVMQPYLIDDDIWIDKRTNLMWSQFHLGQQVSDGEIIINASTFTFDEAQRAAASCTLGSFKDWRVPTIDELKTLMIENEAGYNHSGYLWLPKNDELGWCWSSSLHESGNNNAWYVNFANGTMGHGDGNGYSSYIRVVRSVQ